MCVEPLDSFHYHNNLSFSIQATIKSANEKSVGESTDMGRLLVAAKAKFLMYRIMLVLQKS